MCAVCLTFNRFVIQMKTALLLSAVLVVLITLSPTYIVSETEPVDVSTTCILYYYYY